MQKEIDVINQEHQRQKEIRSEQEKLADQKVIEYMKKKAVSLFRIRFVAVQIAIISLFVKLPWPGESEVIFWSSTPVYQSRWRLHTFVTSLLNVQQGSCGYQLLKSWV